VTTDSPAGTLRGDGDRCGVRFERLYAAGPDELWSALTDPVEVGRWLAPVRTFECRVGGRVSIDFGADGEVIGEVLALEPGRVLEYTWRFTGEEESVVRFELHPRDDGTLLVLDHRRLGLRHGAGYGAGWQAHLDRLEERGVSWEERFAELLPGYRSQAQELGWERPATSAVREALYRGDRAAAEAAATAGLDVFDAAALGRTERLQELLDAAPELVERLSDDGFTPLHLACFSGGPEAVRLLVERGAPLERLAEASFARVRPLGTAAFARQLEAARVLLDAGADPDGAGEGGSVPLRTAEANGDEELVRLLRECGATG
jgi:uncharacterized protein YndB with AHSA1/START domain